MAAVLIRPDADRGQVSVRLPTGPVTLELTAQTVGENILILFVVAALSAMLPAVHTVRRRILDAIWG